MRRLRGFQIFDFRLQLSKAFNRKEREANLKPQSSQRTVAEDAERDLVRGQDVIAMVEMPQGNGDVQFPVYVVEKASEDVDVYTSYEVMQSFLEEIDVENNEYEAYDAEGFILRMSVAELQLSWLSLCGPRIACHVPIFGNSSLKPWHTKNARSHCFDH